MSLELFLRNIKYLFKYNIKHIEQRANPVHDDVLLDMMLQSRENEKELEQAKDFPKVLDMFETVKLLNNSNKSFCRFGDGEIALLHDKQGGVFQKYDPKLAALLQKALSSQLDDLLVGVFYYFFHLPPQLLQRQQIFFSCNGRPLRHKLQQYMLTDITYGDALVSMPYHLYESFDFNSYYMEIGKLWEGKDIVMICGKTVFDKIKYNCFDSARSIEYIYGPRVNAFDKYDSLLEKALATDPAKIKFLILGQTATALAYDLCRHGHRAIDIGHLAKDYNSWKNNEPKDNYAIRKFYDKD